MEHDSIYIDRPTTVTALTLTRHGYVPWQRSEATLHCTCGWRDRTFYSTALRLANEHNERKHERKADIRPSQS